ncbi:MAG: hypothetical protein P1P84_14915 [Deferrisomatales bacterium]|nr:hypothetical protein [Deferrisomatales bacterium]
MAQGPQGKPNGKPQNCWEAIHCGREAGGANSAVLGPCPAATDFRLDGINRGKNGGRACWTVPGTQINVGSPPTGVPKTICCLNCTFLRRVESEEGAEFSFLTEAVNRLELVGDIRGQFQPGIRKVGQIL